jgi:hypothetical protein
MNQFKSIKKPEADMRGIYIYDQMDNAEIIKVLTKKFHLNNTAIQKFCDSSGHYDMNNINSKVDLWMLLIRMIKKQGVIL